MKTSLISTAILSGLLTLTTSLSATVYNFYGDATPDSATVEGSNGASNTSLFTTIVFGGTSWTADAGFLKMTTGPSRGIWFGTSNSGYGDNSGISLSDSATGNRFLTSFLLTPGSQSWGFYFIDQSGYYASIQVDQTDNGQTQPGVWASLDTGSVKVSDASFDPNVLHTFEAHVFEGEVLYRLDGVNVATGGALTVGGLAGLSVIGDGSGGTPTGTGSMWIDYLEIDNAAGAFVPEPATTSMFLALAALIATARRRI